MFDLLLYGLATYRLTYLLVHDDITIPLRIYFHKTIVGKILSCTSCCSVWVAMIILVLPQFLLWILALSAIAIIITSYIEQ